MLGQMAVAKVTYNRAVNSDICAEVYRPKQFSWTAKKRPNVSPGQYLTIMYEARGLDLQATHYHNHTVKPKWAKGMKLIMTIGNHKFYERL